MLEFLKSDPRFAIELFLAVLGILVGIILYYRGTFAKQPCYQRISTRLVDPELTHRNPIRVTFADEPVTTLTMTHVVLWNNGRATVGREDIASSDPLRIVAREQYQILAADIVAQTHSANCFRIELDGEARSLTIDFDFVDYKNGVGLRIYHTGTRGQDLEILGTIKGAARLTDVDKTLTILSDFLNRTQELFVSRGLSLVPRRLLLLQEAAFDTRSCRGSLVYMLVSLPLFVMLMPFAMLALISIFAVSMFLLPYSVLLMWRYGLPRELGSLILHG